MSIDVQELWQLAPAFMTNFDHFECGFLQFTAIIHCCYLLLLVLNLSFREVVLLKSGSPRTKMNLVTGVKKKRGWEFDSIPGPGC